MIIEIERASGKFPPIKNSFTKEGKWYTEVKSLQALLKLTKKYGAIILYPEGLLTIFDSYVD